MSGQEDSEQRALAGAADGAGVTFGVDQLDGPEHPIAHVPHATTRTETPCDSRAMWCDSDATVVRCPPVIVDRMRTEQQLVTGWERHLDVADTLLRRFVFHLAALDAAFTLAGCGRTLDADDVSMADLGRPGGYFNGAVLMRPPTDWNVSLGRIERFAAAGHGQFCLWSAWPTPDLHDRGWKLSGHPPLLVRPPRSTFRVSETSRPHLEFRRVISPSDLAAWEGTTIDFCPFAGLEDAPVGSFASPALLDDDRLRLFVGWEGAHAAAVAASFASHGIASFVFGATMPAARRRGFWKQAAIALFEATPDLWFAGVFGDHSRADAEALGSVPLLRLTLWTLDRP